MAYLPANSPAAAAPPYKVSTKVPLRTLFQKLKFATHTDRFLRFHVAGWGYR